MREECSPFCDLSGVSGHGSRIYLQAPSAIAMRDPRATWAEMAISVFW
jgi:hypothetical protein